MNTGNDSWSHIIYLQERNKIQFKWKQNTKSHHVVGGISLAVLRRFIWSPWHSHWKETLLATPFGFLIKLTLSRTSSEIWYVWLNRKIEKNFWTRVKQLFHYPELEEVEDEKNYQIWQVDSSAMEGIIEIIRASNKVHEMSPNMEKWTTVRRANKIKSLIGILSWFS